MEDKLKRQGFTVATGSMGYSSRLRHLPAPFYEHKVIVYNPAHFSATDPQDATPLIKVEPLTRHIQNGAILLVFFNYVSDSLANISNTYSWIPFFPPFDLTYDYKAVPASKDSLYFDRLQAFTPLLGPIELKIPIRLKIFIDAGKAHWPVFRNMEGAVLGAVLNEEKGKIIVLPQYTDNEAIIGIFLDRVLPRIWDAQVRVDIVEEFQSLNERAASNELERIQTERIKLDASFESAVEKLAETKRIKEQTIRKDETAALIVRYYELALAQAEVALFYLYKIIEALEKKFSGEAEAKDRLGCRAERNLIGRLANASYADIRHAPRPGEKIREWSQEDIEKCFEGAKSIIRSYFGTLF